MQIHFKTFYYPTDHGRAMALIFRQSRYQALGKNPATILDLFQKQEKSCREKLQKWYFVKQTIIFLSSTPSGGYLLSINFSRKYNQRKLFSCITWSTKTCINRVLMEYYRDTLTLFLTFIRIAISIPRDLCWKEESKASGANVILQKKTLQTGINLYP